MTPTAVLGGTESYVKGTIKARVAAYGLDVRWVYPMDKTPPKSLPAACGVVMVLVDMQHDSVKLLLDAARRDGIKVIRTSRVKSAMEEALRLAGFTETPELPAKKEAPKVDEPAWYVAVPSSSTLKFSEAPESIRADNVADALLLGSVHYGEDRHLSVLDNQGHLVATTKQKDTMNLTIQLTAAEGETLDKELRRINLLRSMLGQATEKREEFVLRLLRAGLADQAEKMDAFRKAAT